MFGEEELALAITGYFLSIPMFMDSAFVILYPIAKALAKKGNYFILTPEEVLVGDLTIVTDTTIPFHPGSVAVAGLFWIIPMLLGIALAMPCVISFVR
jgi:GntP family gluconate:H+ symporter